MDKIKTRELPHVCKKHKEKVIVKEGEVPTKPNRVKVNKVRTYNPCIERGMLGGKSLMKQTNYLLDKERWDEVQHADAVNIVSTIDRDYIELKDAKDTGPEVSRLCTRIDTHKEEEFNIPTKEKESPMEGKEKE